LVHDSPGPLAEALFDVPPQPAADAWSAAKEVKNVPMNFVALMESPWK
jgi:hypothetical protein